jgi:hypothetical protein
MKQIVIYVTMMFLLTLRANAQESVAAIMERAKNLRSAQTMSTRSRMVITAKDGSTTAGQPH